MNLYARWSRRAGLCVLLALVTACGLATEPSAAGPPAARSYEEYAAGACVALQSLWRAYGNPDTAALSPMQRAFVDAVAQGDLPMATLRAAEIRAELERGRASAAAAAGWAPGTASMGHMDRLLVSFGAMTEAKLAAMPQGDAEATTRGQEAFEAAGGVEAWRGMLQGIGEATQASGKPWPACEGIPIS